MLESKSLWTNTAPGEITMNANTDFVIKIEPLNSKAGNSSLLLANRFILFYKGKKVYSARGHLDGVKSIAATLQDQLVEFGLVPQPSEEILPPSLAAKPNIPLHDQTLDQLFAERDYWQQKIDSSSSWGASISAALELRDACIHEINRRQTETE